MNILLYILVFFVLSLITALFNLIKNPEKIDRWNYLLTKYLSWKNEKREKRIIASGLDYRISSIAKKINNEADGIIPFGIRIKWKDPKEVASFVEKENVVVVLKKEDNSDKNIVDACIAFVPKAVIPKARNVIDPQILESIDYYMIGRILTQGNYSSAYNYFLTYILDPDLSKKPELKSFIHNHARLDEMGFFTRVLLEEYRRLGAQLFGTLEEKDYLEETKNFFAYTNQLHERKPGQEINLLFLGKRIKIGIVFVAKKATLQAWGVDAHIHRIKSNCDKGVQRQFIFSYSQPFDQSIQDAEGYVVDVKRKKYFIALTQVEEKCRELENIKLLKKQKYYTKDAAGNLRSAKYLLYEVIS